MPRFRYRFCKEGDLRFISHLDLSHSFERAARRAKIPLAFTQGFHPHPRIAFASALSVGATSEAEYVDIETELPMSADVLRREMNRVLPMGIELLEGMEIPLQEKSLMAAVDMASYKVRMAGGGLSPVLAARVCAQVMGSDALVIRKKTKSGWKDVDIRPLIKDLAIDGSAGGADDGANIAMLLAAGSSGMAKPEDVLEAMRAGGLIGAETQVVSSHRTGLYKIADGSPMGLLQL